LPLFSLKTSVQIPQPFYHERFAQPILFKDDATIIEVVPGTGRPDY